MNVACYQVEVSATGRSLVQRSPTECAGVSLSVIKCNNRPLHLKGGQSKQKDFLQADKLITEEINTFEIYGRTLGTTK